MKVCYKCKVEKDVALFGKNRTRRNGLASECRDCKKKANSKYRADNKDKIKEYQLKHYKNNKDKIAEYNKNNKDKIADYRANNRNKIKEHKAKYRANNKDKIKYADKKYRLENLEKHRERCKEWAKRSSAGLSYGYIIQTIKQKTCLKPNDIPNSLIEAKRMQIMIHRKIKEMKK